MYYALAILSFFLSNQQKPKRSVEYYRDFHMLTMTYSNKVGRRDLQLPFVKVQKENGKEIMIEVFYNSFGKAIKYFKPIDSINNSRAYASVSILPKERTSDTLVITGKGLYEIRSFVYIGDVYRQRILYFEEQSNHSLAMTESELGDLSQTPERTILADSTFTQKVRKSQADSNMKLRVFFAPVKDYSNYDSLTKTYVQPRNAKGHFTGSYWQVLKTPFMYWEYIK